MKTITTELIDTGQKKDVRGRKLVSAQEREALLKAYRESGLTQRAFSQKEGIKFCTFTTWLVKERRERMVPGKQAFAELTFSAPKQGWALEVALPNGIVVRANEARGAAELVAALQVC
jgi:hypothetical protein